MASAPSEDSAPSSLISVFAVRMKNAWALSYLLSAQRRLWSDWLTPRLIWVYAGRTVIAKVDLSLRWAHSHFVGFVMRRLLCTSITCTPVYYSIPLNLDPFCFIWYFRKNKTNKKKKTKTKKKNKKKKKNNNNKKKNNKKNNNKQTNFESP